MNIKPYIISKSYINNKTITNKSYCHIQDLNKNLKSDLDFHINQLNFLQENKRISLLQDEINQLKNKIHSIQKENDELISKISRLEFFLKEETEKNSQNQRKSEEELRKQRESNEKKGKIIEDYEKIEEILISDYEYKLKIEKSHNQNLESERKELSIENDTMKRKIHMIESVLYERNLEKDVFKSENSNLKVRIDEAVQEKEGIEKENQKLKRRILELKGNIKDLYNELMCYIRRDEGIVENDFMYIDDFKEKVD